MNKKIFKEPQIEISRFTAESVLTNSSVVTDTPDSLRLEGVNVGSVSADELLKFE